MSSTRFLRVIIIPEPAASQRRNIGMKEATKPTREVVLYKKGKKRAEEGVLIAVRART